MGSYIWNKAVAFVFPPPKSKPTYMWIGVLVGRTCVDSSWNWLQTTQSLVYRPWNRGPLLPEAAFLEGPLGEGALLSGNIYKASVMHRALCWALWGLQRWTSHGCCSQGIFNKACLFRCQKWRCKITTERNKKKKGRASQMNLYCRHKKPCSSRTPLWKSHFHPSSWRLGIRSLKAGNSMQVSPSQLLVYNPMIIRWRRHVGGKKILKRMHHL